MSKQTIVIVARGWPVSSSTEDQAPAPSYAGANTA
jgi:hypothetical protein